MKKVAFTGMSGIPVSRSYCNNFGPALASGRPIMLGIGLILVIMYHRPAK
jgi:hypothetical protein